MPVPRIIERIDHRGRMKRWIGIETSTLRGDVKTFLWFTNFSRRPGWKGKRDEIKYASFLTRHRVQFGLDAAIGPAVDLQKSNVYAGVIAAVDPAYAVGVYVDAERRGDFRRGKNGWKNLKQMEDLQVQYGKEAIDIVFKKALAAVPSLPPSRVAAKENGKPKSTGG